MKKEIEYNSQTNRSTKVFVMTLIGGIFLFLGGFALYAHLTSKKGDDEERDASATSANNFAASSDAGFKCLSTSYPLQLGTCHSDVAIVQRYLKKLGAVLGNTGKNKDGVDGRFGPKTLEATKQYLNKEIFNIQDVQNIRKQLQA